MTIGDVLAFVGFIGGVCLSLWVLLIGVALLFETKANAARRVLENEAPRAFGLGFVLLLPLGFAAIAMLNGPGALKFCGLVLLSLLLAISLLGGAGLSLLLGERTGMRAPEISPFAALSRGAGMMSVAWLFPVLGWFLVAPASIITGLGAGAKVLWKRRAPKQQMIVNELPPQQLPNSAPPMTVSQDFFSMPDNFASQSSFPSPMPSALPHSAPNVALPLKEDEPCESRGAIG